MNERRRRLPRAHTLDGLLAIVGKGAFDRNIARVGALTDIYAALPAAVKNRHSGGGADVLRAAVVLLHASLEDLLRRIAGYRISDGNETALKQIPLAGCAPREKFALWELAKFRGSTVDDVLLKSVRDYYESSVTFNSVPQIEDVLERSGIKPERLNRFYPALGKMIARRHEIVHRADVRKPRPRNDNFIDITLRTQALSAKEVRAWTSVTRRFGHAILVEMSRVKLADLSAHAAYLFGRGPLPKR